MRPETPPEGLSESARLIWDAEVKRSKSAGRRLLLAECLHHKDVVATLRERIATEGLTTTTTTTGAVHIHPLTKLEEAHTRHFIKLAKMLNLEWQSGSDG